MSLARSPPPPARPKRALSRAGVRDAHVPGGQVAQLRRRGELHRAPLQGARRVPLPRRAAARLVRAARVQQDPLRRGDGGGSRSPEIRVLEIPDGWAPHPPPAGERERESRERRGTPPETDGPLYTPAAVSPSAAAALVTLRVKGAVMIAILASTFLCWTLEVRAASGTLEQSRAISGYLAVELNLVACIVRSPLR